MIVNDLGRFVSHLRYEHLPAEVIDDVKLRILDLLAVGLAGYVLKRHEGLLPLFGGAEEASVWGLGRKLPLRDAVLLNCFLAHCNYFEDGSRHAGGHPSSVVIPSAVGLAESRHLTGQQLVTSVAAGYEIFLRLGRAIYPSTVMRGFKSTAVVASVASAAASSNILSLDPQTTKNALAIACTLGVGLKEALAASSAEPIQVARSCEGGVLATQFAMQGAQGVDSIVENGFLRAFADNPTSDGILSGLGTTFRIAETYLKVHGGCRGNHAPIDLIQDLVATHQIRTEAIERIVIAVDSVTYAAEVHEPVSGAQAQFSVAFAVAVALLEGNASIFQYTDDKLASECVRNVMSRIVVQIDPKLDTHYPEKRGATAEIALNDGRTYRGSIDNAKGEPENPFDVQDIEVKFMSLAKSVLKERSERVRDMIMTLETMRDTSELVAQLRS